MPRFSTTLLLFIAALGLGIGTARADLVWTPQGGWRIEGGALSGLKGNDARNALDLMNKARASEERGWYYSAVWGYEKVAKKYPHSVYAPEALLRTAQLRLKRRQYYKAFGAYQEMLERYPSSEKFDQVIGEEYRIANALVDGKRNYVWGLFPGTTNRAAGVKSFEVLLSNAPYSEYAPLALMNMARAYQRVGSPEGTIDALDRLINGYTQSLLAPDAYLKIGQTYMTLVDGPYYDQSSANEAITFFQDYMILFPGDKGIPEAEKGLAKMKTELAESKMKIADFYYYKRSNYTAAKVFYNEAITAYPDSQVANKARKRLAEVEAKAEKARAQAAAQQAKPKAAPRKKFLGLF